jgi:cAMP-binding proteins - catabolite gene activator and regulatory subunit of cAMP-dependent protein kinases
MALDEDTRILAGVRLFQGFTGEQVRLLAFGAERLVLPAGRRLFRQDDAADCAYVVVRGLVRLFYEDRGERVPVADVGPGTLVGELALIADTKRLTGAEAHEESELLKIDRRIFRRILEEYPEIAVTLHRRISADIRDLVSRLEAAAARLEP